MRTSFSSRFSVVVMLFVALGVLNACREFDDPMAAVETPTIFPDGIHSLDDPAVPHVLPPEQGLARLVVPSIEYDTKLPTPESSSKPLEITIEENFPVEGAGQTPDQNNDTHAAADHAHEPPTSEYGKTSDVERKFDENPLEQKDYDQETVDQVYKDTPVISQFVYDSCENEAKSGQDPTIEASLRNVGPDRCPYDHWHGTFCGVKDPLGPDCGWGFFDPRDTYQGFVDGRLFE